MPDMSFLQAASGSSKEDGFAILRELTAESTAECQRVSLDADAMELGHAGSGLHSAETASSTQQSQGGETGLAKRDMPSRKRLVLQSRGSLQQSPRWGTSCCPSAPMP